MNVIGDGCDIHVAEVAEDDAVFQRDIVAGGVHAEPRTAIRGGPRHAVVADGDVLQAHRRAGTDGVETTADAVVQESAVLVDAGDVTADGHVDGNNR